MTPSLIVGDGNWAVKSDSLLGYKTIDGKYYPREMSVVRATTGTRVNEAGLVEVVPYNLLLNTNTFSSWNLEGGTLTSGFTAPDGSSTAYKYVPSSGGLWAGLNLPVMSAGTGATQSIWVKSVSGSNVTFNFGSGYSNQGVSNKTATSQWQLFTNSFAFSDGGSMYINIISDAQGIYVWHPQLVEGTQPLDYLPTTDRLDIARIDYSTGSPALLLEPQRTNLLTYSSSFDNAAWSKIDGNGGSTPIITANYGISPDGTQNADRIQLTRTSASGAYSYVYQTFTATIGQSYTWSVWLKSLSGTPSVALTYDGGATYSNIVTLTNEWERYEFTTTAVGTSSQATFILFQALPSTSLTADFLAYGFQIEAGSYATSYIPTTSASVTRNADSVSKTGISSLIGQQEGTVFIDVVINGCDNPSANLVNSEKNTTASFGISYVKASSQIGGFIYYGGSYIGTLGASIAIGQRAKIAFAYKSGNTTLYVNGVQIDTNTTTFTIPASLDDIFIGDPVTYFSYQESITNNATVLYKERLSNSELATLTTL